MSVDHFDDESAGPRPAVNACNVPVRNAPVGNGDAPKHHHPIPCPCCFCCRCGPPYDGNSEALGWALDGMARSVSFMGAAVFGGTALLNLAMKEAGCETQIPEGETEVPDCDGRVYGIRPTSFLTTFSTVVALVSAILLPLVGSIIDHTRHRLLVGRASAAAVVVLLFPLIFINEDTWFAMGIVVLILAFAGWIHTCVSFAYLPEVSDDEETLVKYTASFTILQYSSTVVYLVSMIGIIYALGLTDDAVSSSRVAQIASFSFTSLAFGYSWTKLFGERPAFQAVPEDSTLLTAGFKNVYRTGRRIARNYRALMWFFVAVSMSDAAAQSLSTIALTYVTDVLRFTSTENGIAVLVLLLGTIPGAVLSKAVTRRFDPVRSNQLCLVLLSAVTALAAAVLTGPDRKALGYVCSASWGVGTGWKYSSERLLVCRVIPEGQDAELMGMYLFAGQVLVWLPALLFTVMNEAGVSMRIGFGTVGIFFVLGALALCVMGDYGEAVRVAKAGGDLVMDGYDGSGEINESGAVEFSEENDVVTDARASCVKHESGP